MRTIFGKGHMKFNKRFLDMSVVRMFVSSLCHSLVTDGKNVFRKKVCLAFNNGIFLELRVQRAVLIIGMMFN